MYGMTGMSGCRVCAALVTAATTSSRNGEAGLENALPSSCISSESFATIRCSSALISATAIPGNIRQLENVVERLIVTGEGGVITPGQLPDEIFEAPPPVHGSLKARVKEVTRLIEKRAIEEALADTRLNVTRAARKLNISRKSLQMKMKEHGLR